MTFNVFINCFKGLWVKPNINDITSNNKTEKKKNEKAEKVKHKNKNKIGPQKTCRMIEQDHLKYYKSGFFEAKYEEIRYKSVILH